MIPQWEGIHNDHLLLYALDLFIAFHYCFKFIYCFPLCFKYIYCFHLHLLRTCEYHPLSPCDLGMKILSGLADYVRPLWGINNHVNPQGIGPMNTPLIKFRHFHYLLRCEYCLFLPLFPL
jgi:hypothetical protein